MSADYYVAGDSPFGTFAFILLALIALATWIILAASRLVHGGAMERPERVAQLYGYSVCLIAVVAAFTSISSLIGAVIDRGAPHLAQPSEWSWGEPSVSSFEAYRATHDRAQQMRAASGEAARVDTIPEAELRRRFEGLRADRIERVRFQTRRSLITSTFTLLVAAGLFMWHWRWVRRRVSVELASTG